SRRVHGSVSAYRTATARERAPARDRAAGPPRAAVARGDVCACDGLTPARSRSRFGRRALGREKRQLEALAGAAGAAGLAAGAAGTSPCTLDFWTLPMVFRAVRVARFRATLVTFCGVVSGVGSL